MPDKFIREIEEILEKAEKESPQLSQREVRKSKALSPRSNWSAGISRLRPVFRVSAGKVILASVSLLLVVILINRFLLVSGTVNLLIGIGVVFLVLAYLLFFMPSSTFNYEKRWRGQPIEEKRSIREKLRRWLRGG